MPLETVSEILEYFRSTLSWLVLSSLGEPLLYPEMGDLLDMVRREHSHLTMVNMTTNVSLLGNFTELMLLPGFLSLSVDAVDRKIYNSMRVGLDYDVVMQNLRDVNGLPKHPNRRVGVNQVIFERNVREVFSMAELASQAGLTYLSIIRGYANGTNFDREIVSVSDRRVLKQVERAMVAFPRLEIFSFTFNLPDRRVPDKPIQGGRCTFPWYSIDITPDGNARPCCNAYGVDLGQWRGAWSGSPMARLRAQMISGKLDLLEFGDCYYCRWYGKKTCSLSES